MFIKISAILSAVLFFSGCLGVKGNPEPVESDELAAFTVEFGNNFDPGTKKNRLENKKVYDIPVIINAVDSKNELLENYNGKVELTLQYGRIFSVSRIDVTDGTTGTTTIEASYLLNRERVAVHEIVPDETKSSSSQTVYLRSGIMGVSDPIFPPQATIQEIQSNNTGSGGHNSRYHGRNLDVVGEMVVLAVIEGGFYLKDTSTDEFSGIYLYTYSTPYVDDPSVGYTLPPGTIIEHFNGSVFEFFGFTEISFPTFRPKYNENGRIIVDRSLIPDPVNITTKLDDRPEMEKWESMLVKVDDVTVDYFFEEDTGFTEYGQFPLLTPDGKNIVIQTLYTAPGFNPIEERDRKTKRRFNITGLLKQHTSARPSTFILIPRDNEDIEIIE
jgi:hypothetical protein